MTANSAIAAPWFPLLEPLYRPIAFEQPARATAPGSWLGHAPFAFWLIEALRPAVLVELGTATGNSYCTFCQAMERLQIPGSAYAIDTWSGDPHSGAYGEEIYRELLAYSERCYGAFSVLIRSTFEEAAPHFPAAGIDLLHIDGYHTFDAVRRDFETWLPKMSERGVILFHDVNVRCADFGVAQLWDDLSKRFPSFTFNHSYGLGVLAVGSACPPSVEWLTGAVAASPELTFQVRHFFARLGHAVELESEVHDTRERLAAQQKAARDLEQQLSGLQRDVTERERHDLKSQSQFASLRQQLGEAQRRCDELADDKRRCSEEHERHDLESQSQFASLRRQLGEAQRSCDELAGDKRRYFDALDERTHEFTAARRELEKLQANLRCQLDQLGQGRTEIAQLRLRSIQLRAAESATRAELHRTQRTPGVRLLTWFSAAARHGVGAVTRAGSMLRSAARPHTGSRLVGIRISQALHRTALFDAEYYLHTYPDVAAYPLAPKEHFLRAGARELRNPHWLFDSSFYRERNPDIESAGAIPFHHFLLAGLIEGRDPHPLFDTRYYLDTNPDVAEGCLPPLLHFLRGGAAEARSPHPLFDPAFYLLQFPPGEQPSQPLLLHFLQQGFQKRYDPHPLFDVDYYLKSNPDVEAARINPLLHYLRTGAKEGRDPHPLFDSSFYLERNRDVAEAGINPLVHYLGSGAAEGRNPHPLFDTRYYLAGNPDVARTGLNPLAHFVLSGAAEARSPHPCFSIPAYYQRHPEVAESQENPLVHYLLHHAAADEGGAPLILPSPRQAKLSEAIAEISSTIEAARAEPIQFPTVAQPEVSVIVCGHNQARYSFDCLRALALAIADTAYEVIFVDDASTDETPEVLGNASGLRYLRNPENAGFLRSVNRAAREARGDYLLLLNNDTLPLGGFCQALRRVFLEHPNAGLAGAMLLYADTSLQEAGGIIWSDASGCNFGKHDDPGKPEYCYLREADYCSAACVMIPRPVWELLGGFSEDFAPCYYEDTDLAFRARAAGFQVYFQPFAKVVHFEGATAGTDANSGAKRYQRINREKFARRWASVLPSHGAAGTSPSFSHDRYPRRRALVIDATTPTPDRDSGSQDTFHLLHTLKQMEWHVSFIPESNLLHLDHYTEDLQQMGVQCLYSPYLPSIPAYLEAHAKSFDLIVFCRVTTAISHLDTARRAAPAAKILFDTVDLHFLREEREARLLDSADLLNKARATRQRELAAMRQADATIVRTDVERDLIHQLDPQIRLEVLSLMRPLAGRHAGFESRDLVAFIGSFAHPPNVDAALYFTGQVWPAVAARLPGSRLAIVGADPPEQVRGLAGARIDVPGHVPDLPALLERCRVTVAPLRFGAGQKGKVLTSLSHGVPCVMTSLAAEGMGIVHGENSLVADLPESMAQAVVDVYSDPHLWLQLSEGGMNLVAQRFSPEEGARRIREIVDRILARPGVTGVTGVCLGASDDGGVYTK